MRQLLPCANFLLCVFHSGYWLPSEDKHTFVFLVFGFIFMAVKCSGKRAYLTVCNWKRCHQSSSFSVCRLGLWSPVKIIKYIKHWSHFLYHDVVFQQHKQPGNDYSSSSYMQNYLQDGLDLSPDQILWPDDDICPNLQSSLGTSELVKKMTKK